VAIVQCVAGLAAGVPVAAYPDPPDPDPEPLPQPAAIRATPATATGVRLSKRRFFMFISWCVVAGDKSAAGSLRASIVLQ
jgi:hypothetical protein